MQNVASTAFFLLQIIGKDLFNVLKEKCGKNFSSFISEKLTLIPGDISHEDLGLKDSNLVEEMWKEVDVVVNLAATTNFDERYYIYIINCKPIFQ